MTVLFEAEPIGDRKLGKLLTMTHVPGKKDECNILVQVHDKDANVYIECMTTMDALILNNMPAMGFATGDGMVACLDQALRHEREWSQKRPKWIKDPKDPEPEPEATEPDSAPAKSTPKARA